MVRDISCATKQLWENLCGNWGLGIGWDEYRIHCLARIPTVVIAIVCAPAPAQGQGAGISESLALLPLNTNASTVSF